MEISVEIDTPPSLTRSPAVQDSKVDELSNATLSNLQETTTPTASVLDPKFAWVAPPELILNCAMESLMPSPGRFMESNCESPRFSLSEQFINGDPTLQSSKTISSQLLQSKLVEKDDASSSKRGWSAPQMTNASSVKSVLRDSTEWPSLATTKNLRTKRPQAPYGISSNPPENEVHKNAKISYKSAVSSTKQMPTDDPIDPRFPWSARMDPSSRNLFHATTPTYLEDGTPKVTIPSHVFLQGLENQKEYVIGQFYKCSTPSGGLVHAVLNRIWGRNCKIFVRKLSDSSYLFHIPDDSTRKWITQRGLWHVDDCLMFVVPWTPTATLDLPVISTIPVWVTLKKIPHQLYSIPGISWVASGLGAPMATSKPRLDPSLLGEAKILVEVELDRQFPKKIALEDKKGKISLVDVEYSWIPSTCGRCGNLGHKETRCLQQGPQQHSSVPKLDSVSSEVHLVPSAALNAVSHSFKDFSFPLLPTAETISPSRDDLSATNIVVNDAREVPPHASDNVEIIQTRNLSEQVIASVPKSVISTTTIAASNTASANSTISLTDSSIIVSKAQEVQDSENVHMEATKLTASCVVAHTTTHSTSVEVNNETPNAIPRSSDPEASLVMGNNQFAVLEQMVSATTSDTLHEPEVVMTASAQRILRDRPVKPSQKIQEMQWTTVVGRGNRGRGGRGRGNNN